MSNKIVKLAWIGSGFVGQVAHLNSFSSLENVQIVGLSELRPKLGKIACQKFRIPKFYKNYEDLLSENKIDGVVAIVNRKHTASLAQKILKGGHNLFTEKPMAATYSQAKNLFNIAKRKKCSYVIGNMRVHDEGLQLGKYYIDKFIKNKKLGKIIYFRAFCFAGGDYCNIDGFTSTNEPRPNNQILPIAPNWVPKNKHKDFEKFMNFFIHDINFIQYFFKKPKKIRNVNFNKNAGNIIFDYKDFFGNFEFGYLDQNKWIEGLEVYFEKGKVNIDLPPAFLKNQAAKVKIYDENSMFENISPKTNFSWSFKRQAMNFVDIISKNKKNTESAKKSLEDLELIEKIWKKLV